MSIVESSANATNFILQQSQKNHSLSTPIAAKGHRKIKSKVPHTSKSNKILPKNTYLDRNEMKNDIEIYHSRSSNPSPLNIVSTNTSKLIFKIDLIT